MTSSPLNDTASAAKAALIPALMGFRTMVSRTVRNYGSLDPVLGRIGSLEVRLATTAQEIRRAQKLRFKVFYKEMSAVPQGAAMLSRRDIDEYDLFCDHLLVLDYGTKAWPLRRSKPKVVGTSTPMASTTLLPC
jgi:putative hemolysin